MRHLVPIDLLPQRAGQDQLLGINLVVLCERSPDRHVVGTGYDEAFIVPCQYPYCWRLSGQLKMVAVNAKCATYSATHAPDRRSL